MASTAALDQLHSSIQPHLAIELQLIRVLIRRSRDQHRGQLFLKRLHGVYRLGRLVQAALLLRVQKSGNGASAKDLCQLVPKVGFLDEYWTGSADLLSVFNQFTISFSCDNAEYRAPSFPPPSRPSVRYIR